MTVDDYLEKTQVSIESLRSAFACYCKLFGLTMDTCFALTLLLLSTRWQLVMMLAWIVQQEEAGRKPDTTEVVLTAEKIRNAAEAKGDV